MVEFIILAICNASFGAWMLTLGYKWEIIPRMAVNARTKLFCKMLNCQFCLTWWTNVGIALAESIGTGNWWLMLLPFVSTKIGLKLL